MAFSRHCDAGTLCYTTVMRFRVGNVLLRSAVSLLKLDQLLIGSAYILCALELFRVRELVVPTFRIEDNVPFDIAPSTCQA